MNVGDMGVRKFWNFGGCLVVGNVKEVLCNFVYWSCGKNFVIVLY